MIRLLTTIALAVFSLLLNGCGATLQAQVNTFHTLDSAPKKYVLIPTKDQQNLEYQTYANLVRQQLNARGWMESSYETADVAVFMQYAIGQGRQVTFTYPIFGTVPTGNTYTTGTANLSSYGGYSTGTYSATTTQQTTVGVVGSGTDSRTEFDRALRIDMFAVPPYISDKKMVPVLELKVHSTGSTGTLPPVMPALVRAAFEDFPGRSGNTRSASVPLTQ